MYQMAPLSWTLLFTYFLLIYLIINSLNFYLNVNSSKNSSLKKKINLTSWKW